MSTVIKTMTHFTLNFARNSIPEFIFADVSVFLSNSLRELEKLILAVKKQSRIKAVPES